MISAVDANAREISNSQIAFASITTVCGNAAKLVELLRSPYHVTIPHVRVVRTMAVASSSSGDPFTTAFTTSNDF
jgi:hypothetical protein